MAFKKVSNREQIGGFWTRDEGSTVVGQVKKFVETDTGGFWLIKLSEGGVPMQGKDEESDGRDAIIGELIAVSGSLTLEVLSDMVGRGVVRLTSNGKKDAKKGKTFWDIEVEFDAEMEFKPIEVKYSADGLPLSA